MPRGTNIRKPCPRCGSLNTKRHDILVLKKVTLQGVKPQGVQRWYCKDCRRPFTPERSASETATYTLEIYEKAAMLYFDQSAAYRAVARELQRMGISIDAKQCWVLVQTLAQNCKAPWEVSMELRPKWSGFIGVDADHLKVADHWEAPILGVDIDTLDIPHLILAEHEDAPNWLHFFLVLKHIGYPFQGVVSDGDPSIESAVRLVCPGIPQQLCVKHFLDGLHRYLRYKSSHGRGTWRIVERFETMAHDCLYALTLPEVRLRLTMIQVDPDFKRIHLEDAIAMLERDFDRLTRHFAHPGLPRTNNVTEGTIRKLDRRLTPMDSLASHQTAWNVLKMLTLHTRFRILTDCRPPHQHRNGQSPLQLAGIDTQQLHWIRFGQQPQRPVESTAP